MKRLALAIPAVVAIAIAGCGSSNNDNNSSSGKSKAAAPAPAAGNQVAVSETDYKLTPSAPKVKKGTVTISVANNGKVAHSLEVEGPGGESKLGKNLQPGQHGSFKVNLSKNGKYEWYCPVDGHKKLGMKGEITVGSGSGASSSSSGSKGSSNSGSGY
jgi:uncharacterized cupredoxin-like copper-binding protein